ncbi:MAG: hypothetical protein WDO14_21745 [Bacteroidota bacterium]
MKFLMLLLAAGLFRQIASAQDGYGSTSVYDRVVQLPTGKRFFIVPPTKEWNETEWRDSLYTFDSFQKGKLEMTNGFVPSHRPMLNYSPMNEGIVILPETGPAVAMRKSPAIKFVWIGDHKYINHPAFGFLEIVFAGKVSLARKQFMSGIYELSNGTKYSIRATNDITPAAYIRVPLKGTTRYYWIEERYFFVGEDMKVFRSTAASLKHLLPKQKSAIKAFSKSNHIDYRKKDEVLKMVVYANEVANSGSL